MISGKAVVRGAVVALAMMGTLAASCAAGSGVPVGGRRITVTLRHAPPSYVMRVLGLYADKDQFSPKLGAWTKNQCSRLRAPQGVESVEPDDSRKTLTIRGNKAGTNELAAAISKLDVAPKQVQVMVESYSLSQEVASQLSFPGVAGGAVLKDLRDRFADAKENNSLISGVENMPMTLRIERPAPSNASAGLDVAVVPRINGDGSITLALRNTDWCRAASGETQSFEQFTQVRFGRGDGVIHLCDRVGSTAKRLLIVTAKVIGS